MIEIWERIKAFWKTLYQRVKANLQWKKIQEVFTKEVAWSQKPGEEKYWGDRETVQEIASFYKKNREKLEVRMRIRVIRGFNTATGLVEDFKKCYEQIEAERTVKQQKAQEEQNKKKLEQRNAAFKKYI